MKERVKACENHTEHNNHNHLITKQHHRIRFYMLPWWQKKTQQQRIEIVEEKDQQLMVQGLEKRVTYMETTNGWHNSSTFCCKTNGALLC